MALRSRLPIFLLTAFCLLLAGTTGCESLQRKLTRKPKHPKPPPNPIISFQDYTRAMTPLDRYRKHYMLFDYWNGELMDSLQSTPLNPKRFTQASSESLAELHTLQGLLTDPAGDRMSPLLDERAKIDRQLQHGALVSPQVPRLIRILESQERRMHREFFWRDVEGSLSPQP